ncbi:MAG: inorganic diphosphatase [Nannocystis sp.]|nr:inorganic diphosphatase [Nannocystis sp.]
MLVELPALSERPTVVIEAPRFSTVKRRSDGTIDFVSPLPCPYNYGSIPGTISGDGDPLDAVVMGRRLAYGTVVRSMPVVGVIDFIDGGKADPKVIVAARPLSARERWGLENFFRVYALGKRALARARGEDPATRFAGWLRG